MNVIQMGHTIKEMKDKEAKAEQDRYLESMEYNYNGINAL